MSTRLVASLMPTLMAAVMPTLMAPPSLAQPGRIVTASVYAEEFHGQTTASGETFWWWSPDQCAHPWLRLGQRVQLRLKGRVATCRVVDRLALPRIDISRGVAHKLGLGPYDLVQVELTEL